MIKKIFGFSLLCFCFGLNSAVAGVTPESSRLVYKYQGSQQPLRLYNANDYPVVVQVWVNDGEVNGEASDAKSPMFVMPPVFKLENKGSKEIKILHAGKVDQADREIVYWLNIHEVPPTKSNNAEDNDSATLAFGMRTQMKIFYRPEGVTTTFEELSDSLEFSIIQEGENWLLRCKNKTPLHASFTNLGVVAKGESDLSKAILVKQELDMMTPPFSERDYQLTTASASDLSSTNALDVKFALINDVGADYLFTAPVDR